MIALGAKSWRSAVWADEFLRNIESEPPSNAVLEHTESSVAHLLLNFPAESATTTGGRIAKQIAACFDGESAHLTCKFQVQRRVQCFNQKDFHPTVRRRYVTGTAIP